MTCSAGWPNRSRSLRRQLLESPPTSAAVTRAARLLLALRRPKVCLYSPAVRRGHRIMLSPRKKFIGLLGAALLALPCSLAQAQDSQADVPMTPPRVQTPPRTTVPRTGARHDFRPGTTGHAANGRAARSGRRRAAPVLRKRPRRQCTRHSRSSNLRQPRRKPRIPTRGRSSRLSTSSLCSSRPCPP